MTSMRLDIFGYNFALRIVASLLTLLCLLASCADDMAATAGGDSPDGVTADEIEMNLIVCVPSMSHYGEPSSTRSLPFDDDRESRISVASLVLFNQDSLGRSDDVAMVLKGKYLKRDEAIPSIYRFKVSIYVPDPDDVAGFFNAMVIANAHEEMSAVTPGMKYQDVKKVLVRRFTHSGDDFTPQLPKDNDAPLPMWGELKDVSFPTGDESSTPTYSTSLLRSVARVDVTVDNEIPSEKFRIESVYVVNGADAMAIVPDSAALEPLDSAPGHWHAIAPTLPEGVGYNVRWDHDSVAVDNIISHTLYIPEADVRMEGKRGDGRHAERTAVIVGAHYLDSDSLQYYRIDFYDEEADTLVDVRRNHLYAFHITKVECEGSEDVMSAYNEPLADEFEASLIEWDLPHRALTYLGNDWISASREILNIPGYVKAGEVVEVKSSLPLTTFRIRWLENEKVSYFRDVTQCDSAGVEAEVEVKGDLAKVAVVVTRENPPGNNPRLCNLSLRITPQLSIVLPVIIHPLEDQDWDDNHPIDIDP